MKRYIVHTLLSVALLIPSAFAQKTVIEKNLPGYLKPLVERLEQEKHQHQGGVIAILHKGRVVYKTAFGHARGNEGAITPSTLFPLASVSKAVTAVALALQVEQGRLSFDRVMHAPCFKGGMGLKYMMSHTSGFAVRGDKEIERGLTQKQLMDLVFEMRPKCKPGACYTYSNLIYGLIEASLHEEGMSFKRIIDQLSIELKTPHIQVLPLVSGADVAYPHALRPQNKKKIRQPLSLESFYTKNVAASAGIFASLDAMIEFYRLSFGYRPDLISRKTLAELYTPVQASDDIFKWYAKWPYEPKVIQAGYGLGWRVLSLKKEPNQQFIFHSGYINGINSFIGSIPSAELGIVIIVNEGSAFASRTGLDLWREVLKNGADKS
ncbi:MAG: serine hydrolase domain-containing protein [Holosporales bacterium]